jgi:hypothetical protein
MNPIQEIDTPKKITFRKRAYAGPLKNSESSDDEWETNDVKDPVKDHVKEETRKVEHIITGKKRKR